MSDRATLAATFRELHECTEPLLIPNPWDAGTAILLEHLGFQALATTSLGAAIGAGRKRISRDLALENCRAICQATSLPVNADMENCFADDPAEAAQCIALVAETGAVGMSIEDNTGNRDQPIYDFNLAVERVAAAVEAAHSLPVPMFLTARAENLLFYPDKLDDTIGRLQAFEAVGADVLYAPYIRDLETMKTVVDSVSKPVNIVMGYGDPAITLADLRSIGVSRVSIGGALTRIAMAVFLESAKAMRSGEFGFVADIPPIAEVLSSFR